MAQRICQQDQFVSLNPIKSCKDSSDENLDRSTATSPRRRDSASVPFFGRRHSHGALVFRLPSLSSTTLSVACGKRCEDLTIRICPDAERPAPQSLIAKVLTSDKPLPTHFPQAPRLRLWSQQLPLQGDLKPTDKTHQNLTRLLSSETVIKYSSRKQRSGRTISPCFIKRTAP